MKKAAKWLGACVLLLTIIWTGIALGQTLTTQSGGALFEAATMHPYVTLPPADTSVMTLSPGLITDITAPFPTATPLSEGWYESGDMFADTAESVLTVKAYGKDDALLSESAGMVVFDHYTIAVTSNLLDGAARLEAHSKAGYTYQITKVVAVQPQTGIALLEFQSPTDLKPLIPGDEMIKEGSLVDLIGQDESASFFWKEGKVSAFSKEGAILQCNLDIPDGFIGGVLLNKLGHIIGIPYQYKRDAELCYALDIKTLQSLFVASKGQPRSLIGESATTTAGTVANAEAYAPENLTAKASEEGTVLTWDAQANALRYYVYRAQGDNDLLYQLDYVYEPGYIDTSVETGVTYTYTVKAVYSAAISPAAIPVEVVIADVYIEPEIPLLLGGNAFLNAKNGMPSIDLRMENTSRVKTVTGVSVAIFMKDAQGEYVLKDDGSDYYAYFDIDLLLPPMSSAYSGPLYLAGFENVKSINVAITGVNTLEDGKMGIPNDDWAYSYWTIE